jgi:hypothetical protein
MNEPVSNPSELDSSRVFVEVMASARAAGKRRILDFANKHYFCPSFGASIDCGGACSKEDSL